MVPAAFPIKTENVEPQELFQGQQRVSWTVGENGETFHLIGDPRGQTLSSLTLRWTPRSRESMFPSH